MAALIGAGGSAVRRLAEIIKNLADRIAEARINDWLGHARLQGPCRS